ncbi:MAG: endolytic transglycosylase MltG [Ilumatobacteraceae bacterium]|nr:endolytic transglycosylase MltG [Ilumatobacteraceae bacterium]
MRDDVLSDDRRAEAHWRVDPWDDPVEVPVVEAPAPAGVWVRWLVVAVAVVVAAAVLTAGVVGWWLLERVSAADEIGDPVRFDIAAGDDLGDVAAGLAAGGFIADAGVFEWYVEQRGGLEVVPGLYRVRPGAHLGDVLSVLRTPPDETYQQVTFPEGFTVAQIADRLDDRLVQMDAAIFLALTDDAERSVPLRPDGVLSLEGLLFPDTYRISNADNEGQVIERMLELMERVVAQEDVLAASQRLGLSPYEILTVASMIEREAKVDADRAVIARVIYNRLARGMRLEIDATLYYGAPAGTPFDELRDTDSPYNTYLYSGLPPTPIANPGRASIRAAVNPAPNPASGDEICAVLPDPTVDCDYLFYVLADDDGSHEFAVTFEQHQANIDAARRAGVLP